MLFRSNSEFAVVRECGGNRDVWIALLARPVITGNSVGGKESPPHVADSSRPNGGLDARSADTRPLQLESCARRGDPRPLCNSPANGALLKYTLQLTAPPPSLVITVSNSRGQQLATVNCQLSASRGIVVEVHTTVGCVGCEATPGPFPQ